MSPFSQLVEWLGTNPWWGFVSFIIGVLAVLVAIISSFKSFSRSLFFFAHSSSSEEFSAFRN